MTYTILNDVYIFLESIFWGYGFFVLALFIFSFVSKNERTQHALLNWLSAINICFVLAMVAMLADFIILYFETKDAPTHWNFFRRLDRLFNALEFLFALLFLFERFRIRWSLSVALVFLINWYKIYYLAEGEYGKWVSYLSHVPGRNLYPLVFIITLLLTYAAMFVLNKLPYPVYWLKWKRRPADV